MALVDSSTAVRGRFAKYLRSSAGNATMIVTIAAIPMIGCVGLAVDYMRGVRASEALQSLADAAALAAASAENVQGTTNQKLEQRAAIATNFINTSVANVSDIELVGEPQVTTGPNTIDVNVKARVKGSFINVLNALEQRAEVGGGDIAADQDGSSSKDIDLHIHSKAAFTTKGYKCLLAMDPHRTEAIYFQGNSEFMATCSVQANSDAAVAIRTWGSAYAYATSFCAVGGWSGSGFEPTPRRGCSVASDPYASLAMPTVGACNYNNKLIKNETASLSPGVYCGGISLSTHGVANLAPGLYIIKNGKLTVDSQSELQAPSGVVFYLTGNSSIDITSGALVTLNAPTNSTAIPSTEAYKGMAFMQDRTTGIDNTNVIYSKGGVNIMGAVYTPKQNLLVWANGPMNADSKYFPMIANSFTMNGTSTLYVNLDYEGADLPEPTGLGSSGKVFVSQ